MSPQLMLRKSMKAYPTWFWMVLVAWICSSHCAIALLPFPLAAGQRGTVACLESPSISYDVYLPPNYSTNSAPLPILYTFNPNGGGMVSFFQNVSSNLNIITIGVVSPRNGTTWDLILRDCYAVARDIRTRVIFDPTAEIVAGFSGGGVVSYGASRFRPQHVAGVYAMAGWLGRGSSGYPTVDRVQTNLLVARSTGNADTSSLFYRNPDSNYLASCGAVIKDWTFSGGHEVAPDSQKTLGLTWILDNRVKSGINDRTNAFNLATNWQARIVAGEQQIVLREAVNTLLNQPRSWFAYQAQLILDQLTSDSTFRTLDVAQLAEGDFASNQFYFSAKGATLNGDLRRYYACMKALTGISGVTGDRTGGIYSMLTNYGYLAPILRTSFTPNLMSVSLTKDTPGLNYFLQTRSTLVEGIWQDIPVSGINTTTVWSASVPIGISNGFHRIRTTPKTTSTPTWP